MKMHKAESKDTFSVSFQAAQAIESQCYKRPTPS
jgi:hypothetical protein